MKSIHTLAFIIGEKTSTLIAHKNEAMAASSATMPNGVFKDAPVPMEVEGDNKSDALSDSIEKIEAAASAASDDKKHAATTSDMGGSLRPQELAQLSRLCLAALTTTSELVLLLKWIWSRKHVML